MSAPKPPPAAVMAVRKRERHVAGRIPAQVRVLMRSDAGDIPLLTENVNKKGMFVRTDQPLHRRELARFIVDAGPDGPLEIMCVVRHTNPPDMAVQMGTVAGMGVQLYAVSGLARRRWDAFVRRLERLYGVIDEPASDSGPRPGVYEALGWGESSPGDALEEPVHRRPIENTPSAGVPPARDSGRFTPPLDRSASSPGLSDHLYEPPLAARDDEHSGLDEPRPSAETAPYTAVDGRPTATADPWAATDGLSADQPAIEGPREPFEWTADGVDDGDEDIIAEEIAGFAAESSSQGFQSTPTRPRSSSPRPTTSTTSTASSLTRYVREPISHIEFHVRLSNRNKLLALVQRLRTEQRLALPSQRPLEVDQPVQVLVVHPESEHIFPLDAVVARSMAPQANGKTHVALTFEGLNEERLKELEHFAQQGVASVSITFTDI